MMKKINSFFVFIMIIFSYNVHAAITGVIDIVSITSEAKMIIHGWACDHGISRSIDVHLYLNGDGIGATTANRASEQAVSDACGVSGGSYRFQYVVDEVTARAHAGKKINIYGISISGGNNLALIRSGILSNPLPTEKDLINDVKFEWGMNGPIADMHCEFIDEGAEPINHEWHDNYLCTSKDIGIRWRNHGEIPDMKCTQINEPSDPHTWSDNYLCLPKNSSFEFSWSHEGERGASYVQWNEHSDPDSWNNNYLNIHSLNLVELDLRIHNQCIDTDMNDFRVQGYNCHNADNQKWTMDYQGRIHLKANYNKCIDYQHNPSTDGTILSANDCNNSITQQWVYENEQLRTMAATGKCMDLSNSTNGTDIQLRECSLNNKNQRVLTIHNSIDPMDLLLDNLPSGTPSIISTSLKQAKGFLIIDYYQVSQKELNSNEIASIKGFLNADGVRGESIAAKALRQVLNVAKSMGMQIPTPVKITVSANPQNGSLDLAIDLEVINTWIEQNVNHIVGTKIKFNTLNLVFHITKGLDPESGELTPIEFPINFVGRGYIKPTDLDPWLAVAPTFTITQSQGGVTTKYGGSIIGSCGNGVEPQQNTDPNTCQGSWDLLSKGVLIADREGDNIGDVTVTYINGTYEGINGTLKRGRITPNGPTINFSGHAGYSVRVPTSDGFSISGSASYLGLNYNLDARITKSGAYSFTSTESSIHTLGMRGSKKLIIDNAGVKLRYTGQFCADVAQHSCSQVCSWLPWPLGEVCDEVCSLTGYLNQCLPEFSQDADSNGNICSNTPIGSICQNIAPF